MARSYAIYDVFSGEPLAGNPLAVIFDGEGLTDSRMQAIAREFNLAETVFVSPPASPAHAAALRIFTPGRELPFAGHPTVGTAIALAERSHGGQSIDLMSVLEEKVGPVRCAIRLAPGEPSFAEFDLPRASSQIPAGFEAEAIADALGVAVADIGFENHRLSVWSAGVPFVFVPLAHGDTVSAIRFQPMLWRKLASRMGHEGIYVYAYGRGGGTIRHPSMQGCSTATTASARIRRPAARWQR